MGKLLDIKLKKFFSFLIFCLFIGLGITFYLLHDMYTLSKKLNILENNRYELTQKADILRQSSDDLTRFARTYVVTGDDIYRQNYFEILDIRDGKLEAPKNYNAIYWDFEKELREKRHPSKLKKISLRDILKKMPYSKYEFDKLKEAENNSNELVNLEVKAFKAMLGKSKNQKLAIELMHSKDYHSAKQKIMLPIDEFLVSIQNRTNKDITKLTNLRETELNIIIALYTVFLILFFILMYVLKLKILQPVDFLVQSINRFINNPDIKLKKHKFYNDEIGVMSNSFFSMNSKIVDRTRELKNINTQISKSIDFASIIQQTFNYKEEAIKYFFNEYFIILKQKDTVGGDIVLFEKLNSNECLLMNIDCTSHGVPGAFVTMIVKTLQRQIIKEIKNLQNISPSDILIKFNYEIKHLLEQTKKSSKSNVGFDGQVLYYNKITKILKFASARNDIIISSNNEVKRIRGDRHSVGYKDSNEKFKFKEHTFKIQSDTNIYVYSDGFTDQLGGKKSLPFGNRRTLNLIQNCQNLDMNLQKEYLLNTLTEYKNKEQQNDDISFIGLKIKG